MKIYKIKHEGIMKYCAFVETGEKYASGRLKEKRFISIKRFDAVAKAEAYKLKLKNHLPTKTSQPTSQQTLGSVYVELQDEWDTKVQMRERNPKKKKTITDDTRNRYEDYASALFKVVSKDIPLSNINKKFVNDLIKTLNKHKTESAAYRIYSPTQSFKEDRPTYDSEGERTVDDKEMKAIYKQIVWSYMKYRSQSALILLIEANTGARWGEAAALHHTNFDFKNNIIHIKFSKSSKSGKI